MKNTFFLLLVCLFAKSLQAQDTLVSNTGVIIPAFIVASDSQFISYKSDTSKNEINLVQRSKLLLIKHREGRVDKFYANDTLITMKGEMVLTKILEIDPDFVTCFYYNGIISEPTMVSSNTIFMLKLQDGTHQLMDHSAAQKENATQIDYFKLGEQDGQKYFRTSTGAIAGEVISGICTWMMVGVIPGAAIGFTKPMNIHNELNKNDNLLNSNSSYREGYMNVARKKKSTACAIAYTSGLAAPVVLLIGIFYNYR